MAGRLPVRLPFVCPVLVCIALAGTTESAEAQWKWKDATGHTQYSDVPPPAGTPESRIVQRPFAMQRTRPLHVSPASAASATAFNAASSGVDPALEARRRQNESDDAARIAAKRKADDDRRAAQQKDACLQARTQLRTLGDGMRIARINASGEREYLDDQARANESQRARDVIASDCK